MEYGTTVRLYMKENRLWELKGFEIHPSFTDGPDQNLIFSTDKSLPTGGGPYVGNGRYTESLPCVRIPTLRRFLEAVVLLLVRDRDTDAAIFWQAIICYMIEYVIKPGRLSLDSADKAVAKYTEAQMYPGVSYQDALIAAAEALSERVRNGLAP